MRRPYFEFSIVGTFLIIIFLNVINWLTTPHNWWSIYPSFLLLFHPLGLLCQTKKGYKWYSVISTVLLLIFFIVINLRETPDYLWFLYILAPLVMWPITAFIGKKSTTIGFSIISTIGISLYYVVLNVLYEPRFFWSLFPIFVLLWWPITLILRKNPLAYSLTGSGLTIIFFIILNWITTPDTIWAIYPIFGILWWPLAIYYFIYRLSYKN